MSIFEQLFKMAQKAGMESQKEGELDQDFFLRLVKTIGSLPDEDWDSLSRKAQDWQNEAAKAKNEQKPLPFCPGFKTEAVVEETLSPTPKKSSKSLKTTLKQLKKKKGALHTIRETILLHPQWSNKEVYEEVVKTWPGTRPETVAVNGSDIRHTIDLAKKMGFWKDDKQEISKQEITIPPPTSQAEQKSCA